MAEIIEETVNKTPHQANLSLRNYQGIRKIKTPITREVLQTEICEHNFRKLLTPGFKAIGKCFPLKLNHTCAFCKLKNSFVMVTGHLSLINLKSRCLSPELLQRSLSRDVLQTKICQLFHKRSRPRYKARKVA